MGYCDEIAFIGGEALLWPPLIPYLRELREKYAHQYGAARVLTNGTIPLTPELLDAFASNQVVLELTIYPAAVPKENADQIEKLCCDRGVDLQKICHEGWHDFGLRNGKRHLDGDNLDVYRNCSSLCRGVCEGQYIYCTSGYFHANALFFSTEYGTIPLQGVTKETFYKFHYGLCDNAPKYCEFCNGWIGNEKECPVAEQLDTEM